MIRAATLGLPLALPVLLGSPAEVIENILELHELLGNTRYIGQIDVGGQSFAKAVKGIELLATKVAPAVRRLWLRTDRNDSALLQASIALPFSQLSVMLSTVSM